MKIQYILPIVAMLSLSTSCSSDDDKDEPGKNPDKTESTSVRDLSRSIELIDKAVENYFEGENMKMSRFYNPYTGKRSEETGSVWMYTSSIEAVNAAMKAMKALKENGRPELYDANFSRYASLLDKLYDNLEYYNGSYTLTSYTGTNTWSVYAVNRSSGKGSANVQQEQNVYDDQMWIIREMLESYHNTGEEKYLTHAEYLSSYVFDGWDCTLDRNGNENGGITWGPSYVTKHSCSNGPMVSPAVWLHEIYKNKSDEITYGYIKADNSRSKRTERKSDYYLSMAKKIYKYQKDNLYDSSTGVYSDMMGGDDSNGKVVYDTIDGVTYRKHTHLRDRVGEFYTYNSGTMLSGAADLYRATGEPAYLSDLTALSDKSFNFFATADASRPGCYTFNILGFRNWFNGVLMRGYVDAGIHYPAAKSYIEAYQNNLDYAYDNHLYNSMLPPSLLIGWNRDTGKNNVEAMFTFAFAAEYALLATQF